MKLMIFVPNAVFVEKEKEIILITQIIIHIIQK